MTKYIHKLSGKIGIYYGDKYTGGKIPDDWTVLSFAEICRDTNWEKSTDDSTWTTMHGREIKFSDISHQHWSNIFWYHHDIKATYQEGLAVQEIAKRFGGVILPYKEWIPTWDTYDKHKLGDGDMAFWTLDTIKGSVYLYKHPITYAVMARLSEDVKVFGSEEAARRYVDRPKLLLRTHDGVEIYDPEAPIYSLLTKGGWDKGIITARRYQELTQRTGIMSKSWLYFATRQARDSYLYMNQPVFSVADVVKEASSNEYKSIIGILNNLTEEAKKKTGYRHEE